MSDTNDARRAHEVLDGLSAGRILSQENEQLLRDFLPKLPKQMSLEALRHDVHDVWAGVHGNEWPDDMYCDLETWLAELHAQLKGLKDTPATVPALPAGMRLADHEEYGRCVVSPKSDAAGVCDVMHIDSSRFVGSKFEWAHECELTFIDAEPAHPEFLETVEDYENAPVGTIVAIDGNHPWVKENNVWMQGSAADATAYTVPYLKGIRRVLRWGDA